jgi:hypothetical protein
VSQSAVYRAGHWQRPVQLDQPVFILACARSGSTLLRFILDAHPELACPAETEFASAAAKLAHVWLILQGTNPAESSASQTRTPKAKDAVRRAIDDAVRDYLYRHGKSRWCDKSLDNAMNAELLADIWPDAKFICLTRHCMDVIASASESARWGLNGFGLSQYSMRHGSNTVAAISDYWIERTGAILRFRQRHPDRCHGMRYEDLVTRPEETVAGLLAFLGVADAAGITQSCFRMAHERGPGDEKIWLTTSVHSDSLGRGGMVPVRAMPQPMRVRVNQLLTVLGYDLVTEHWKGSPPSPAGQESLVAAVAEDGHDADEVIGAHSHKPPYAGILEVAADRLEQAAGRWPHLEGRIVGVTVRVSAADIQTRTWRIGSTEACPDNTGQGSPVDVVIGGELATWQSVLGGRENLVAACLSGRLAISGHRPVGWPAIPDEAHAIAFLLGLDPVPTGVKWSATSGRAGPVEA